VTHGATAEDVERFFSPTTPVVLPAFGTDYVEPAAAAGFKGYVDVMLAIDTAGRGTITDVTQRTPAASNSVVQALEKQIEKSRYRPRLQSGEWVSQSPVPLRYYFTY